MLYTSIHLASNMWAYLLGTVWLVVSPVFVLTFPIAIECLPAPRALHAGIARMAECAAVVLCLSWLTGADTNAARENLHRLPHQSLMCLLLAHCRSCNVLVTLQQLGGQCLVGLLLVAEL